MSERGSLGGRGSSTSGGPPPASALVFVTNVRALGGLSIYVACQQGKGFPRGSEGASDLERRAEVHPAAISAGKFQEAAKDLGQGLVGEIPEHSLRMICRGSGQHPPFRILYAWGLGVRANPHNSHPHHTLPSPFDRHFVPPRHEVCRLSAVYVVRVLVHVHEN